MGDQQLSLTHLAQLLSSDIVAPVLASILAEYEQQAVLGSKAHNVSLLSIFYSAYILVLMLTDDLEEARGLALRVPAEVYKNDTVICQTHQLLAAMYSRKHEAVYTILRSTSWPQELATLVGRSETYFRERTLVEISKIYAAITPATAAGYLGYDVESQQDLQNRESVKVEDILQRKGWRWDEKAGLLFSESARGLLG